MHAQMILHREASLLQFCSTCLDEKSKEIHFGHIKAPL